MGQRNQPSLCLDFSNFVKIHIFKKTRGHEFSRARTRLEYEQYLKFEIVEKVQPSKRPKKIKALFQATSSLELTNLPIMI